ncbi:CTP-dependent riboflavin kinase [Candidatus Micrarchaeota archaeon]|nr:CTP-dependent riboflavin kinase [Candidatus Micrarchaeota archaeon]MBU2477162.1 CTP-dependent riboflavin kinase [Candidatus Micrarchaeota archaeon]
MDFPEKDFPLLLFIAGKAGLNNSFTASTSEIASELNISQQSVSRKLSLLAKNGFIQRKVLASGNIISLTEKGIKLLEKRKSELERIFSGKKDFALKGKVQSGLKEGKYYIGLSGYQTQFRKFFGKKVFAGTLNLKVNEFELKDFLQQKKKFFIQGFSDNKRSFGPAFLFKVKLNNSVDAAIIIPERTNHPEDIIEIISPFFLRKKLKLKDNDEVKVS